MMDTVQLGEVVTLRKGKKAVEVHEHMVNGSRPYIQIDEVRGIIPQRFASDPKGIEVVPDDLCIVWDGANAGTVGYGVEGLIGSTVARMRLTSQNSWDTRFIGRLLQSRFQQLNEQAQARGATIPHVDKEKLETIALPRVSKNEQQRIVAILDKADGIRRELERTIAMADDLIRSDFHEMFEGHEWLTEALAGVVAEGTIVTYGIVQAGPEHPNGIPYIRTGDIKNGKIAVENLRRTAPETAEKYRRSTVCSGEIVMSIRATVGTTAVVPPELHGANLTQGTARIAPGKNVTLEYLLSFLRSARCQRWLLEQVKGATFREITLTRLRELQVPLPPIEQQRAFSAFSKSVATLSAKLDRKCVKAAQLFGALSQRAFREVL